MLRPIEKSDLELILSWRNDPTVRHAMLSQHEITLEEHQQWFERMRVDDSKRWYLYVDMNNEPNGVIYFTKMDARQGIAVWGFYVSPHATSGTGTRMLLEALDYAFKELKIQKLIAEVLVSNQRSLRMHKRIGFVEEGKLLEHDLNGKVRIDLIRFGMHASDWCLLRESLAGRVNKLDD